MKLHLSDAERHLQAHCRERADYVPVTVVVLNNGRSVPSIADDLGVSQATRSTATLGLAGAGAGRFCAAKRAKRRVLGFAHQRPT